MRNRTGWAEPAAGIRAQSKRLAGAEIAHEGVMPPVGVAWNEVAVAADEQDSIAVRAETKVCDLARTDGGKCRLFCVRPRDKPCLSGRNKMNENITGLIAIIGDQIVFGAIEQDELPGGIDGY